MTIVLADPPVMLPLEASTDGLAVNGDGPRPAARRLALTGRGLCLLVLGLIAVAGACLGVGQHLHVAASLLLAPLIVDWLAKPRLDRLGLRVGPLRTPAGRAYEERVEIANAGRCVHDVIVSEPRNAGFRGASLVRSLPPGERCDVLLAGRSRRRGHAVERLFRLETHYPLGLVHARGEVAVTGDVVTEPARVRLARRPVPPRFDGAPDEHDSAWPGSGEFHSLHEHQPGQDARLVHAGRSASLGMLVQKVMRGQRPREVVVVLDLRAGGEVPRGFRRRFERALRVCATLLDELHAAGVVAVVRVAGRPELAWRIATRSDLDEVLTFLAEVEPTVTPPGDEAGDLPTRAAGATAGYWIGAQRRSSRGRGDRRGFVVLDEEAP